MTVTPPADEPPDAQGHTLRAALGNRYLVVQRDVKPVNIVFNDDGHAMITALGMATPHEILPRVARAASIARLVPTSTTPV